MSISTELWFNYTGHNIIVHEDFTGEKKFAKPSYLSIAETLILFALIIALKVTALSMYKSLTLRKSKF